jgi:hypothetical protein
MFKTNREFLEAVIAETANEDIKAFALASIDKLDTKNANRKSSKAALDKIAENDAIKAVILDILTASATVMSAGQLAVAVADKGVKDKDGNAYSTNKISALAGQLADEGELDVDEKFKPEKGKGAVKGYSIAEVDEPEFEGEDGEDVPTED